MVVVHNLLHRRNLAELIFHASFCACSFNPFSIQKLLFGHNGIENSQISGNSKNEDGFVRFPWANGRLRELCKELWYREQAADLILVQMM